MKINIRFVLLPALLFCPVFFVVNRVVIHVCRNLIEFDCPSSWPIGVVMARVPPWIDYPNIFHIATALVTILAFCVFLTVLHNQKYRIDLVIALGTLLILGSTLTHGVEFGFVRPIVGMGVTQAEYYNDALKIEDPLLFISDFKDIQPQLYTHSRTHPPGAVLFFYYINKFVTQPFLISILIAIFSGIFSGLFLNKLLCMKFDDQFSGFITFVFLLIPSIQIYYAASLDAIIATLLLGALTFFVVEKTVRSTVLVVIFLLLASFLTFGFVFILPVILLYEFWLDKSITRSSLIIGFVIIVYILIHQLTGFSYSDSFLVASAIENPEGFRLLADPFDYFTTRIENVAEIVFFFGPYLSMFALSGIRKLRKDDQLLRISFLGIGTLILVFLAGAYKTGETARATIFIYPYLMLLVASHVGTITLTKRLAYTITSLVFVQTMIMQLVANFFW